MTEPEWRLDEDEFGAWVVQAVPTDEQSVEIPYVEIFGAAGGTEDDGTPAIALTFTTTDGVRIELAMRVEDAAGLTQMIFRAFRDLGLAPRPGMN